MNATKATEKAIEIGGGPSSVGRALGVSHAAVQQWRDRGRVPAERVLALEALCEAKVTRYQLRPDVYGAP